jgi:hypothetical protein
VDLDAFLPLILPYVPGCPDATAKDHAIKAGRIFCSKTRCWAYETAIVLTQPGVTTYALDIDDGEMERVRLLSASIDGRPLTVLDARDGRSLAREGGYSCDSVWLDNGTDVGFLPAPTVGGAKLVLQIAVKPALTATEWPDELAEYLDDVAHGAISSLTAMPRVAWRDTDTAQYHEARFRERIAAVGFNSTFGYASTPAKRLRSRFL